MEATIGLIGGMTPESTILYYRELHRLASEKYGNTHTCKVLIDSVDFGKVSRYQKESRWDLLDEMMVQSAKNLENGGASCVLICANTMHLTIDAVKKAIGIPVIHIAEATAKSIKEGGIGTVALLGTRYTMEKTFYADVLEASGIKTIIPAEKDRAFIHKVIYEELAFGLLKESSKNEYIRIINALVKDGAKGVILGCTEIPMLIAQKDVSVPVFDTTTIHATNAFNLMNE